MTDIYRLRNQCLLCSNERLTQILPSDTALPLGCFPVENLSFPCHTVPYNAVHCESCGTVQTKYIGNIELVYGHNFAGLFGTTRNTMNSLFADFISTTENVKNILEIGAGNGDVCDAVLEKKSLINYTIVDPSYWGSTNNRQVLNVFFENVPDEQCNQSDTVVMSHVFEHFYNPLDILKKIQKNSSIKNILLNWPNLEEFVRGRTYNVLNMEHIFYVENEFLENIFKMFGFEVKKIYHYNSFAIFYHFVRSDLTNNSISFPKNKTTLQDTTLFFDSLFSSVSQYNKILEESTLPAYIWPCSVHTSFCFMAGLNQARITSLLDNSPGKIGKYQYGFSIPCVSFCQVVQSPEKKILFLVGGQYAKEVYDQAIQNPANQVFTI